MNIKLEKLQGKIKAIEASTDDEETSRFLEIEEMHAEVIGQAKVTYHALVTDTCVFSKSPGDLDVPLPSGREFH